MIGSREWMNISQGKLSFKEKIQLISQVLVPVSINYTKTFLKQPKETYHFQLNNIQIPDKPMVKEAIFELESTQNQSMINHSWRCYIWGTAFAQMQGWQYDQESLVIASLMHDLGLIEHLAEYSCDCFSLESSLRAERLCAKFDYPKDKTENISNAICLHQNGYLDPTNVELSKEVLLLSQATSCDVIATQLSEFSAAFRDEVLARHPRLNFNNIFKELLKRESQRNPSARTYLLNQFGLSSMISMNAFKQ